MCSHPMRSKTEAMVYPPKATLFEPMVQPAITQAQSEHGPQHVKIYIGTLCTYVHAATKPKLAPLAQMMMDHALPRVKSNLCRNAVKASRTACCLATLFLDLEAHREHRQTKPIMLMAGCGQNLSGKAVPLGWARPARLVSSAFFKCSKPKLQVSKCFFQAPQSCRYHL